MIYGLFNPLGSGVQVNPVLCVVNWARQLVCFVRCRHQCLITRNEPDL